MYAREITEAAEISEPSVTEKQLHVKHDTRNPGTYLRELYPWNSLYLKGLQTPIAHLKKIILFYPIQFQKHLHKNHIYTLNAWACPFFPSTVMEIADTAPSNAVCPVAHFHMVFTTDEIQGLNRECFSSRNTDRISRIYFLGNNSECCHHPLSCFISCIWTLKRQILFS